MEVAQARSADILIEDDLDKTKELETEDVSDEDYEDMEDKEEDEAKDRKESVEVKKKIKKKLIARSTVKPRFVSRMLKLLKTASLTKLYKSLSYALALCRVKIIFFLHFTFRNHTFRLFLDLLHFHLQF